MIATDMKPKILVVDDEVDAVELLEFNLKPAGFDVLSAKMEVKRSAWPKNTCPI